MQASHSSSIFVLGTNLRSRRKEMGLPLKALAADLGISIATLSDWERGTRFPSREHLETLSRVLNIPICRLFCPGEDLCPMTENCCKSTT